jgi:hypothetical protein
MSDRSTPPVALIALLAVALAACSPGPTAPASGGPTPAPSSGVGDIDHATGRTDLVLRVEEGGGFVPPGFLVTEAPAFSLYGDGSVIFRDPTSNPPPPVGQVSRSVPFSIARLSEDQVQTLLAFALGAGGLGIARADYQLPVADAPTTTFTVHAGGLRKTVSVNGLGLGADAGADAAILTALAGLRARLVGIGAQVSGETVWAPDRYRGILMDGVGNGAPVQSWPWTTCTPDDFVLGKDVNAPPFPIRTMTPAEVAQLGVDQLEGGAQGFVLQSPFPAGVIYSFALRPLLPDEVR